MEENVAMFAGIIGMLNKAFATLINRPGVGRKGLWESNPFVVVYEFKLIK